MCLFKVDKVFSGRGTKVYTGWKVFAVYPRKLEFENSPYKSSWQVPFNQWLTVITPRINDLPKYPLGFHIFDTKKGALIWADRNCAKIRQVWYKGILVRGRQTLSSGVTVAKHLYVRGRRKRPEAPK